MSEIRAQANGTRVLAFTCSRHRAVMLRHCILQLQAQTHVVDHAIFVNSDKPDGPYFSSYRYDALLEDARDDAKGRMFIAYGASGTYHHNYTAALRLVDLDDYDLFLKIDDDDIYLSGYVEAVVADFMARGWDYSGSHSQGWINGHRWFPRWALDSLGVDDFDATYKLPTIMPSTAAFSRRAIAAILAMPDSGIYEDYQWRRTLGKTPGISTALRQDSNFVYNVHGGNVSTAKYHNP